ncbi:MAG TPA: hypothetical protein VJM11_18630 [Nevskiaceae bacterium]|nr:hypothetical protein [Nevskiaceae bacterium]
MRLALAGAFAGIAFLVTSCAPFAPTPEPPRRTSMRDYALLAGVGDVPRTKVVTVNGRPIDAVGQRPDDAPYALTTTAGVWLPPGRHVVQAQFVRNIEGGIAFATGDTIGTLRAGHTYMVHPVYGADRGAVRFTLVDYGPSFPHRCLPASIGAARDPHAKHPRFTTDEILACTQWVAANG